MVERLETPPAEISEYVRANEVVLWWGRPDPKPLLTTADWFAIPFSLVWAGLPGAAFVSALVTGNAGPGLLFFTPFLVVGQYLVWGRFVYKRWAKRRTLYVITDRRALVMRAQRTWEAVMPPSSRSRRVHRGGRYADYTFGSSGGLGSRSMLNNGLDLLGTSNVPAAFFDVRDFTAVDAALAVADELAGPRRWTAPGGHAVHRPFPQPTDRGDAPGPA